MRSVFEIRCNLSRPSGPIGCKSCRPEGELAGPKCKHALTYFYVVIQLYILGGSGGLPPVKKKKCKLNQWKPLFPAQKLPARPGRLPEKLPARRQTCRFCADGPAVISNTGVGQTEDKLSPCLCVTSKTWRFKPAFLKNHVTDAFKR